MPKWHYVKTYNCYTTHPRILSRLHCRPLLLLHKIILNKIDFFRDAKRLWFTSKGFWQTEHVTKTITRKIRTFAKKKPDSTKREFRIIEQIEQLGEISWIGRHATICSYYAIHGAPTHYEPKQWILCSFHKVKFRSSRIYIPLVCKQIKVGMHRIQSALIIDEQNRISYRIKNHKIIFLIVKHWPIRIINVFIFSRNSIWCCTLGKKPSASLISEQLVLIHRY